MKTFLRHISLGFVMAFCLHTAAQTYDTNNVSVGTFAGSGFAGFYDGQGTQTMFNSPNAIVADSHGNLFVMDSLNFRVRKITPGGTVSTFVGGGASSLPGYGTNVSLSPYSFSSMAIDHSDVLWIPLRYGRSVIRIGTDGSASQINLTMPAMPNYDSLDGVCVDSSNNVYFAANRFELGSPFTSQILRYRTDGNLEVFAGEGVGAIDGNGVSASFNRTGCMATDAADNVYVWDRGNHLIRRIDPNRNVVTLAGRVNGDTDGFGTNAAFSNVQAMCVDDYGQVFLACNNSIRKLPSNTNVVTMAGSFTASGYTNGDGNLARFSGASGICLVSNALFVADSTNQRIRQISFTQIPLAGGSSLNLELVPAVQITGLVGRQYRIESSIDATSWNVETNITLDSSSFFWVDRNAKGLRKFYQAWLLP